MGKRASWAIGLCLAALAYGGPVAAEGLEGPRFVPPPAKEGFSYPDCYCRDSNGNRVEVGDRACLKIGRRQVTAICGMSLNNPAWRTEAEGCPFV